MENKNILIVDDEPDLREIIAFDFESAGFNVLQADSASSAFEIIQKNKIDVLISDIRMPGEDGVSLFNRLKNIETAISVVIFVTGYPDITIIDAFDMGVSGFFQKPFDRRNLVKSTEKLLLPINKRWAQPIENQKINHIIEQKFLSIDDAQKNNKLIFGKGGFNIYKGSAHFNISDIIQFKFIFEEGPIKKIEGQGLVRWVKNENIGLEIFLIEQEDISLLFEFVEKLKVESFIPKPTT